MRWCLLLLPLVAQAAPPRLASTLDLPAWVALSLEHRTRLEHLDDDPRAPTPSPRTAISLRTLLKLELTPGPFRGALELADSRAWANDPALLNDRLVNPLEPLNAHVGLALGALRLDLGRHTIDLGSRRLVARNDFRNTINAFTGLDASYRRSGHAVRAFAVVPVIREPRAGPALVRNDVVLDRENFDALLVGLAWAAPPSRAFTVDAALVGLVERDGFTASSDRRLVTASFRLLRPPSPATVDGQLELFGQAGVVRATTAPTDTTDRTHLAASLHATVGYTAQAPLQPRLAALIDLATGDDNPGDGRSTRFDPLFGARRFEFGPTGVWGLLSRANLVSPGVRLLLQPTPALELFAAWRPAWLWSRHDAWAATGLTGSDAQPFLGHHLEGRFRWTPPDSLFTFDTGLAAWLAGPFALETPVGRSAPSLYGYAQVTVVL
ncbi:MAG: alginate export family protein [Myxococcaceae bacterium]|nr:alginate export family protein [Myxococcaceae bacterium]